MIYYDERETVAKNLERLINDLRDQEMRLNNTLMEINIKLNKILEAK